MCVFVLGGVCVCVCVLGGNLWTDRRQHAMSAVPQTHDIRLSPAPCLLLPAACCCCTLPVAAACCCLCPAVQVFEASAPPGSWTFVLKHAGHTTFMKPPTGVETWLLDRVFGGGESEAGALRDPLGKWCRRRPGAGGGGRRLRGWWWWCGMAQVVVVNCSGARQVLQQGIWRGLRGGGGFGRWWW